MPLPEEVQINAWDETGEACRSPTSRQETARWAGRTPHGPPKPMLPDAPADLWNFRHEDVGWGLVLEDRDDFTDTQKARAEDAPEPIRQLVEERGHPAPVFRYQPDAPLWKLVRYYENRPAVGFSIVAARRGIAPDRLPRYLLIYGPPAKIPWDLQYRLQAVAYVGRLHLEGQALERYVSALLDEWGNSQATPQNAVVWAVDNSPNDITHLMRSSIADPLAIRIGLDEDLTVTYHGKNDAATGKGLLDSLLEKRPALIVTTSHGLTPAPSPTAASCLGLPIDGNGTALDLDRISQHSLGDGAIWYAHACCSAGAASPSGYDGVVQVNSRIDQVLKRVAAIGDVVAPLPTVLLGAEHPCRAFIGHVEPTFDCTLRQPETRQLLTDSIVTALYERLYQFHPISYVLDECHQHGPQLELLHHQAVLRLDAGEDSLAEMLALRLCAQDRESLVILGDPTAALPPFAG